MDSITITIKTDNAAFAREHEPELPEAVELVRILRDVANKIEDRWWVDFDDPHPIFDCNGNHVGEIRGN